MASEISLLPTSVLLDSQVRFENLLATATGVQRDQIQAALDLINGELDEREDAGQHDDNEW